MSQTKRDSIARAEGLVFLCSGNVVRSAFADLYARHLGCPLPVRSAASTYRNASLFPETESALLSRGVDPVSLREFVPTHIDDLMPGLPPVHTILAMRHHHIDALRAWPEHHANAYLLDDVEIADPVLEGAEFGATYATVAECVETLVRDLRELGPTAE